MAPFREPLRTTLLRNGAITIVVAAVLVRFSSRLNYWWIAILLALWPSFGGHWVEVWFLIWLRPHLSAARGAQVAVRVGVWFIAGIGLTFAMRMTATAFGPRPAHWVSWWLGGLAFIGVELIAHLAVQLRGRPSFYNGRG